MTARNPTPRPMRLAVLLLVMGLALLPAGCGSVGPNAYLRANQEQLTKPASVDTRPARFVIEPGTPAREIGRQLEQAGLITDAALFEAYVRANGLAERLHAGTFVLNPSMTMLEVVAALQDARAASVRVTIPEGWRLEQVADALTADNFFGDVVNGVSAQARRYAQLGADADPTVIDPARYPFLQARPPGANLEGFLFPATYEVPADETTAEALLLRQLDAFAAQVLPLYQDAVNQGATQLPLYDVLTLAAIVEREAVVPSERPTIAGVYLNRLVNNMRLDADPTVQYAMGYQPATGQWWKTPVFLEEYAGVNSPYNTYLNPGLPPGPIAAPGLDSVRAVLYPESHDFLYFVAVPEQSGAHVFAQTFAEHEQNVARYLRGE
jgi:UPF0755 protein